MHSGGSSRRSTTTRTGWAGRFSRITLATDSPSNAADVRSWIQGIGYLDPIMAECYGMGISNPTIPAAKSKYTVHFTAGNRYGFDSTDRMGQCLEWQVKPDHRLGTVHCGNNYFHHPTTTAYLSAHNSYSPNSIEMAVHTTHTDGCPVHCSCSMPPKNTLVSRGILVRHHQLSPATATTVAGAGCNAGTATQCLQLLPQPL